MRHFPESEDDRKELECLNVEDWMVEQLKQNPNYCSWGPYEDYMTDTKSQWASRLIFENWKNFGPWELDDLNEVVNFYFEISRESKTCNHCDGDGYNPKTKKISDEFYSFDDKSKRWCDSITQDEVQALVDANRLTDLTHNWSRETGWVQKNTIPTAEEVNERNRKNMGHDAINRWILIEARAKRLGVWGDCEHCDGEGYVFTEPKGRLNLVLWMLHPRKGCSRGIYIKSIQKHELTEIKKYLLLAASRNSERFSKIKLERLC